MSVKIVFASSNRHKIDEIKALLPEGFELLSSAEAGFTEDIEETGTLLARKVVKEAQEIVKPKNKKLNEKLKLQEATEALEESETKEFEEKEVIEISIKPKKKKTRKNV